MLEARIATLEDKLRSASVIDAKELSADVVRVGSSPRQGREGQALLHDRRLDRGRPLREPALERVAGRQGAVGHKKGDEVTVQLPNGKQRELKITKIEVA